MKFLADENVEKPVVEMLRMEGHHVLFMSEFATGTVDDQLLDRANRESRILITNDKDFGELIFLQNKITTGIILMRFLSENSAVKCLFMKTFIKKFHSRLTGNFVVVTEGKVRIRPLR